MTAIAICPTQASYSTQDTPEVIATELDGGAPRMRRDVIGSWPTVDVQWVVTDYGRKYLRAFFRAELESGSLPFQIELTIDDEVMTVHDALFVPASLRIVSIVDEYTTMSAQLRIKPRITTQEDLDYVVIYNTYGEAFVTSFPAAVQSLQRIVNVDIPAATDYLE